MLDEEEAPAAGADGVLELLAALEPPDAESCFGASADEDELADDDGGVAGVVLDELADDEGGVAGAVFTDAEPETELPEEGELGVVEPADEDDEEPGVVVRETARSPSLSQPVRIPAPSARETATAKVVSLIIMGLRGLGVRLTEQGLGLSR